MCQKILRERRKNMIENRNLTSGTKLTARYRKQPYTCEVVEGEGGKLLYRLEDGREFKSLSAAGTVITGKACNGWAFWSLEGTKPEGTQVDAPTDTSPSESTAWTAAPIVTKPDPAKKTGTYKMKNQKGTPEGEARWFCYDCGEPFHAPVGKKKAVCPNKHS
jgi:hypothetical protein